MKGKLLRIGTIILGNVFVAFAVSTLVLENQLISGGVTGLGIVTNHYTGINISLIVGIINVLLFLLGLLVKNFLYLHLYQHLLFLFC